MHKSSYPIEFSNNESDRLDSQAILLVDNSYEKLVKTSASCLEIGCGVGSNLKSLRELNKELIYTGVDICEKSIRVAKTKFEDSNTDFIISDASEFKSVRKYDLVFIRLVLWGVKDIEQVLETAYKSLNDGGYIYIYEPNDEYLSFYPPKERLESYINNWQKSVITKGCDPFVGKKIPFLLSQLGFQIVTCNVNIETHLGIDKTKYLSSINNLWKIFSASESIVSEYDSNDLGLIECEINTVRDYDYFTEGYISAIGRK